MLKKSCIALGIILILLSVVFTQKTNAQKQEPQKRNVKIERATPENPVVYLGKSYDKKAGKMVDGYAIVHYAKNTKKPAKPSSDTICYSYIAKGAKWRNVEPWFVDSTNSGLSADYILQNMSSDIFKWEDATDGIVNNGVATDILGEGFLGTASSTLGNQLDYKNEMEFASIDNPGAIAVTYIWGIFGGPIFQRELVEWDQVYNTAYAWSASGEAGKMDFENITTHELGHSVGMGDLYTSGCNQETMYGYADYGQTNKRDLNIGDIAGINLLY